MKKLWWLDEHSLCCNLDEVVCSEGWVSVLMCTAHHKTNWINFQAINHLECMSTNSFQTEQIFFLALRQYETSCQHFCNPSYLKKSFKGWFTLNVFVHSSMLLFHCYNPLDGCVWPLHPRPPKFCLYIYTFFILGLIFNRNVSLKK